MAKRGRIEQPTGGKMDVSPDQRAEVKKLRKAAGLSQQQLADKIGVSNGTISNLESGKHDQPYKSTYLEVLRVLKAGDEGPPSPQGERFKYVMDGYLRLSSRDQGTVESLIRSLLSATKPG